MSNAGCGPPTSSSHGCCSSAEHDRAKTLHPCGASATEESPMRGRSTGSERFSPPAENRCEAAGPTRAARTRQGRLLGGTREATDPEEAEQRLRQLATTLERKYPSTAAYLAGD